MLWKVLHKRKFFRSQNCGIRAGDGHKVRGVNATDGTGFPSDGAVGLRIVNFEQALPGNNPMPR